MSDIQQPPRSLKWWWIAGPVAVVCIALASYPLLGPESAGPTETRPRPAEASSEEVHQLCAACHAYPPPDSFPRHDWRKEVTLGYDFFHKDPTYRFDYPPLESVVRYYEARAPERLPVSSLAAAPHPAPVTFDRRSFEGDDLTSRPGVAHVEIAHLFDKEKPDVIACDAIGNRVLALSPYEPEPGWRELARDVCCARAEVADLDGDGVTDVILAALGSFYATDDRVGSVVWLRGVGDGTFEPVTLIDGIGRVADARAGDFTGDGKTDLIVAVFGWLEAGEILLLENRTEDGGDPEFAPRLLDDRHGTSHVPPADLNGDGKLDFVALISQEHETVVAFLNEGGGEFRKETIFDGPHPAFGMNGCGLVDLDADGDLDVLLTNGDALDPVKLLRPYHGVHWLENEGTYPFTPHRLADCYGAGGPVAADFDGNGLLDVAFVSFLPGEFFPQRETLRLDSVVLLEQTSPGEFARHSLATGTCDHPTCAAGDLDGDGRPDLVTGQYIRSGPPGAGVTVWFNATERP